MEACSEDNTSKAIETKGKGFVASLLGQFSSRDFWKDLFALIVREAVSSFISVLGGTLIYAVQQRTSSESSSIRKIAGVGGIQNNTQPQTSPNNAFSNGYTPQPSYRPTYPSTNQSYPGFGQ